MNPHPRLTRAAFVARAVDPRDSIPAAALASAKPERRVIPVVASTADVDSCGDIVDQDTWDLARFLANPVALYQHDHTCEPIGYYANVRVESGALRADLVLYSDDVSPEAGKVWARYQQGGPVAVSVGFRPGRVVEEERDGRTVRVLYDCALEEISVVTMPANPNAVAAARRKAAALYLRHTTRHAPAGYARKGTPPMGIMEYMQEKGMDPAAVAMAAGLSEDDLAQMSARSMAPDEAQKAALAKALDISPEDLASLLVEEVVEETKADETVEASAKGKASPPVRKGAQASGDLAALLADLGVGSVTEGRAKIRNLVERSASADALTTRVKALETTQQKALAQQVERDRADALAEFRRKAVLTPAREKAHADFLTTLKTAADVRLALKTWAPEVDTSASAREPERGASGDPAAVKAPDFDTLSKQTGLSVELLKKGHAMAHDRPVVR